MSILKSFERRLRERVEGLFARGPAGVQPVELGEWLADEMDEQRMVGREKVYAPSDFTVYLGPADASGLAPYLETLSGELSQMLFDHARERGYSLAHVPQVRFARRESLPEGEVDVETRLAEPSETSGTTKIFSRDELTELRKAAQSVYLEQIDGTRHELTGEAFRIGRLSSNDLALTDTNVSRTHCIFERIGDAWHVRDLGSTNGTMVNGRKVTETALSDGDVVTLGVTQLTFRVP